MNNYKKTAMQFLMAQTVSLFGSSLVQYAIIWHITLTTSSGVMMGMATLAGYLPQVALSLFAGALLDRHDKRLLMMLSDALVAGATLAIAILFALGYQSIWLLLIALMVRSAGTGIQTPAVNAFLPEIVPKEHLLRINGINSTLNSMIIFLSPMMGGLVLSMWGIEFAFFIDVATAAVGIWMLSFIKGKGAPAPTEVKTSTLDDIKGGFLYLKKNLYVRQQIMYLMIVSVLISPSAFLTPLLVSRHFGDEVSLLTITQVGFSLGAMVGGILISTWGGFKNRRHTIILATFFYGSMMIGMGASPLYPIFWVFNFLIGISMPCYNAPLTAALQENSEPAMHGRVFSMLQIASACSLPLGTLIFGPLADVTSVKIILICTGASVVLFACFSYWNKRFSNCQAEMHQ